MLAVFCALGHGKPLPTERGRGIGCRAGRARGIVTAGAACRGAGRLLRDKQPPQNATRCRAGTRDRRQQYGVRLRNPAPSLSRIRPSTRRAPNDGKTCAPCMIWGARAAKRAPSWQDLRAAHPRTTVCRAFRMHGANILPKPARFGCMAAICCQEGALFPSEAPSGTHEVKKLPQIASRERTAARSCHCRTPGERISRAFCHRRAPGNASRRNIATVSHS